MNRWEKDMKLIQGWWDGFAPVATVGATYILGGASNVLTYILQFLWSLTLLCGIGIFAPFFFVGMLIKTFHLTRYNKKQVATLQNSIPVDSDGLIQWETLIPWATVDYNYICFPHDPSQLDQDVAKILLDDGYKIYIDWVDNENLFHIRLCHKNYENAKKSTNTNSIDLVINIVLKWAGEHYMPSLEDYA